MPAPATPTEIRYETEHYVVRPAAASDASERVCAWFANPQTARMLNAPARPMALDALQTYFASHDGISTHILGVFDKERGVLLGFWAVYVDWDHREFQLNVVVGERGPGGVGVRRESQRPLIGVLFDDLDLETMRASVLARNEKIEQRFEFWRVAPEHTSFSPSENEPAPEEIHHYSITRDQWRRARETRFDRDRLEKERQQEALPKAS